MIKPIHRIGDLRTCGASTVPTGAGAQRKVFINGQIVALNGDVNTHGGGVLQATTARMLVNGIPVVRMDDPSTPDALCPTAGGAHCAPAAAQGSPNVFVGS